MMSRRQQGQRASSLSAMKTEYQDKYVTPRYCTAHVLRLRNKLSQQQQQQLDNAKSNQEETVVRPSTGDVQGRTLETPASTSCFVAKNWLNYSSKLPPVTGCNPVTPKQCCCSQFCPSCTKGNHLTTYTRDFQTWANSKRKPYVLKDNFKASRGMDIELTPKEHQPIETTTTYNSTFKAHKVQSRKAQDRPFIQTSTLKLGDARPSCCGHCINQCKGAAAHLKSRPKLPSPGKICICNVDRFKTTVQTDFQVHKLQRVKPFTPAKSKTTESRPPFEGMTTMRDDFRKWDVPPPPSRYMQKDWTRDYSLIPGYCPKCHNYRGTLENNANNGTVEFEPRSSSRTTAWVKRDVTEDQTSVFSGRVSTRD